MDDEDYSDHHIEENREEAGKTVTQLPTLDYYQKTYAQSLGGNDQKATGVFKQYESTEKLRRLQNELQMVKAGIVSDSCCDRIIGKKRKSRHASYEHWAELMLLWLVSAKR